MIVTITEELINAAVEDDEVRHEAARLYAQNGSNPQSTLFLIAALLQIIKGGKHDGKPESN
jgi:hypothetical protein